MCAAVWLLADLNFKEFCKYDVKDSAAHGWNASKMRVFKKGVKVDSALRDKSLIPVPRLC